ncbi:hypothetical protein GJAV_G00101630 [Gymnothorax javanicus]|nr:hypothetical protein GJAV_G00101630 [Gymnothorax javanicus]
MGIKLYYTSVTALRDVKSKQSEIMRILDGKDIQYEAVDISSGSEKLKEMREKVKSDKACPPQIFNDDQYCGDYDMFKEAVENETVEQFLKLA